MHYVRLLLFRRKTGGNREPSVHGRQRSSRVHERARAQRHRPKLRVRGKH